MISSLNTYLQPFFVWLLRTTLQASLLICLILLIQAVLGNRLGARWRYCLWLVLFVRMAMPWAPQSHISVFNLLPQSLPFGHEASTFREPRAAGAASAVMASGVEGSREGKTGPAMGDADSIKTVDDPARQAPQMPQNKALFEFSTIAGLLPLLWLAGASALAGYILLSNILLWRIVRSERPLTDQGILDLLEDCKDQIGTHVILAVIATDKVNTPALFGFVRPRLLLPKAMIEELTLSELRYIFLHELAHLKRHDIVVGYIASLLHVLHWFNPVVWFGFRRVRADRELATDALAMSSMKADETPRYGHAIIHQLERFLESRRLPSLAGLSESKAQIKRRMTMIAKFQNNSYRWSALGIGIITVLGTIAMIDPARGTGAASPAPEAKAPMTMRLVQKQTTGYVSASPDGRYLCDCDTFLTEGIITIRELATGEQRTIKPTKRTPEENGPQYPVLSPDNKTIAYVIWHGRVMGQPEMGELCLIGADGSGQRVLCPAVRPIQWFPDGSRVLGIRSPKNDKEIEIVSVSIADGSVQTIKTLSGDFWRTTIRLSPDAKYIACELPSKDAPAKCDILAVEIDSKRETPLVGHPADDKLLGWTPDGRHILFISDRMGPWSAWLLSVAKGQAQGTPELVARNMGDVAPVGFAGNGSYYYRLAYNIGSVYTAAVNLITGQLLSAPAPLEAAGFNRGVDWSPDGKYLAYRSQPAPAAAPEPGVIRIRSLATGEERELIHKIPTPFRCIRWSPDGRSLLASGVTAYQADQVVWMRRACRIDVDTGDTTVLLESEKRNVSLAELSPDGKTLYYSAGAIVRRQIDTGQEKEIFTFPQNAPQAGWALSPNGEFIATGCNEGTGKSQWEGGVKKLLLIPAQGGQATELVRWEEPTGMLTNVAWSRDSKTVLFMLYKQSVTGGNARMIDEFWQVTTDGGQPRKITETAGMCYDLRVHPDGQRIAFSTASRRHELWMMENFLPPGAGSKDSK